MSVRVHMGAERSDLERLSRGETIGGAGEPRAFLAESQDEQDEFDTMSRAAEYGRVVVVAEVEDAALPFGLSCVQAWHLDADGSGALAWYATQELDEVLRLLP